MYKTFEVFEKLLEERGLTPYKVSKATKVSTSTLTDWKNAVYEPKLEKLILIADYLEVPVDVFIQAKREDMKDETGSE